MLTYTFSRREKALMLVLAIVLVGIAWYMLVFQHTNNEIIRLDGEISTAQTEAQLAMTRSQQMQVMQEAIAEYEAAGATVTEVPTYDNMTPLMTELNGIMGATTNYTLSFDDLDRESVNGYVLRGVRADYACGSYAEAEAVVTALANGAFPCRIDTVSIKNGASSSRTSTSGAPVSASVHVIFFEKTSAPAI